MSDRSRDSVFPVPADDSGREVDWKLLFNQLFALEIKKEHVLPRQERRSTETLDRLLQAYTLYTPKTFNDALDATTQVRSSADAYKARKDLYGDPHNRRLISDLDLRRCVGDELRRSEGVRAFLDAIWRNKDRPIPPGESFAESPEGRNMARAFAADGEDDEQEVALVIVPGYAGHIVKWYLFEELVTDFNAAHGRAADRPLVHEEGIDIEFESHRAYYASGDGGEGPFDILHTAGKELGNTTGPNVETTDLLHEWVLSLPERYARKKLIFFGYSKGAPIVLDLVRRHPELSPRILGYVTFGGVLQGTQVARLAIEEASSILRDVPIADFIDKLRSEDPERIGEVLSPLFTDVDLSWLAVPRIREVFDVLGYDVGPLERQVDRLLGGREVRELLDGAKDLSPVDRMRWNLRHLNDETFKDPVFIANLSALTDVQDFVRPVGLRADDPGARSMIAPVLNAEGTLDWKHLSLDALFLYVTSIEGFRTAPGGLFDTQVELANSKTPILDRRPLSDSLSDEDLAELWTDEELQELWQRCGVESAEDLGQLPRQSFFASEGRQNIDAIDLGEFRGTHWSPFIQAIRPPPELSTEHASWDFPRAAYMRALLQLLAFYNLVRHAPPPSCDAGPLAECDDGEGDEGFRDVVFFRSTGLGSARTELLNLYNLLARAAAYGIVVNTARTGLGTSPRRGPALRTESLYYQGLRLYSAADAEFRRGLVEDPSVRPLPRSLALIASRFPGRFANSYPEEPVDRLAEVHRALKVASPGLEPFELRQMAPGDYAVRGSSGAVSFAPIARENLWRGTRAHLAEIESNAFGTGEDVKVEDKLKAMLSAFTPLCTVFSAAFDPDDPEQASTRLTLYAPCFSSLHADDLDDPSSWYLEKGVSSYELPRPVQLAAAELTHIRYLQEADPDKHQAIKLEVHRDFAERDRVTVVASFGRLFDGSADELYGFDATDRRDALHVVLRPRFRLDEAETPADRRVRETFNNVFGQYEVDVQLHMLTLRMQKKGAEEGEPLDEALLRPTFDIDESRLSFRVNRYVDTAVEHLPLQAAGFTCRETVSGPSRYHCWRDFWTWEQLRDEFFYGRPSPGAARLSLPTHIRGRLLEQVVGSATKAVVDRVIEEIEDAIDEEIAHVVDDTLKRYSKARGVLIERLHEGLF